MGTSAPAAGVPAPNPDASAGGLNATLIQLLTGQAQTGPQAQTPAAPSQDPWLQMQQQAHDAANSQWGTLQSPGATPYQVGSALPKGQNADGSWASGEDWAAQAQKNQDAQTAKFGASPGINYKGQTGPYGPVGDLAPNQYVARADQWAANGSGPAIAPAIQQAINEDPRLSDLYSNLPIQKINNVGNGFGVLPGALTPGVALHNAGQIPAAYNDLLKYSAQNPGSPQGMGNLGPNVAQYATAHPYASETTGVNRNPVAGSASYYDYSSPNGNPANSAGAQKANAQQPSALNANPQLQMLVQLLMGAQGGQTKPPAGAGGLPPAPNAMAPQAMSPGFQTVPGANPLLSRSQTQLNALNNYR